MVIIITAHISSAKPCQAPYHQPILYIIAAATFGEKHVDTLTISLLLLTILLIFTLPFFFITLRKKQQLEHEIQPLREQQPELSLLRERNQLLTQEKQQQQTLVADLTSQLNQTKQQNAVLEQRVQHKNEQLNEHEEEEHKTNT